MVVVLIIAILAAIAIAVFMRQREKAYTAQSMSALRNGAEAVESYAADHQGDYSLASDGGGNAGDLYDEGFRPTDDIVVTIVVALTDGNEFCLNADHAQPISDIYFDSDRGITGTAVCTSS